MFGASTASQLRSSNARWICKKTNVQFAIVIGARARRQNECGMSARFCNICASITIIVQVASVPYFATRATPCWASSKKTSSDSRRQSRIFVFKQSDHGIRA
jgi:hypothetical protein